MLLSKFFSRPTFSPTRALIAASLCTASIAGVGFASPAAAACQGPAAGCVLPVGQAPAPPPPAAQPAPPIDYDEGGGIGLLPILIGLAALAGLLWLLLNNDDEDEVVSP